MAAVPSAVRVRTAKMVRARTKLPMPTPMRVVHTQVPDSGETHRPTNPTR